MAAVIRWRKVLALMMNEAEIWMDIAEFPNYKISTHGNVFSLVTLQNRRTYTTPSGYLRITLRTPEGKNKGKFIHSLVGDAFCPETQEDKAYKRILHFKDGDKMNVHWSNLERQSRGFITQGQHISPSPTSMFRGVTKMKTGWKTTIYFKKTRHIMGIFPTQEIAASVYNALAVMIYTDRARQNPVPPLSSVPFERYISWHKNP